MKIKDILDAKGTNVVTIGPEATLREAITKMVDNKVGSLVVEDGDPEGIITERDILREVYSKSPLEEKQVQAVMTRSLVTGSSEDSIEYVMTEMTKGRFRHMPIVEGDKLVGIIAVGDVVKAQLGQIMTEVGHLIHHVTGRVFED